MDGAGSHPAGVFKICDAEDVREVQRLEYGSCDRGLRQEIFQILDVGLRVYGILAGAG